MSVTAAASFKPADRSVATSAYVLKSGVRRADDGGGGGGVGGGDVSALSLSALADILDVSTGETAAEAK